MMLLMWAMDKPPLEGDAFARCNDSTNQSGFAAAQCGMALPFRLRQNFL